MKPATIDFWYPYVIAALAALGYWLFLRHVVVPKTAINVLGAVVSLAGIAAGFLAAIQSIFVAIDDRPIIHDLKESNTYDVIVSYLYHAMWWSVILAITSVVGLLKDFNSTNWPSWAVSAWVFCAVASAFCTYRIFRVFQAILMSRRR